MENVGGSSGSFSLEKPFSWWGDLLSRVWGVGLTSDETRTASGLGTLTSRMAAFRSRVREKFASERDEDWVGDPFERPDYYTSHPMGKLGELCQGPVSGADARDPFEWPNL
jgi:hypothetical protein